MLMQKMKSFFGRRKKAAAAIAALVVLAAGGGTFWMLQKRRSAVPAQAQAAYVPTVVLNDKGLYTAVNVTGLVGSAEVSNVTTALPYKIKTVHVKVGDMVQVGDVIVTLDTADLEKELENERKKQQETLEKLKESLERDSKAYQSGLETLNAANAAKTEKQRVRTAAQAKYDTAAAQISSYLTAFTARENEVRDAQAALNSLRVTEGAAIAAYDTENARQQALQAAGTQPSQPELDTLSNLLAQRDAAVKSSADAQAVFDQRQALLTEASAALKTAQDAVGFAAAQSELDAAKAAAESASAAADSALKAAQSAEEARNASKKQYDSAGQSTELSALKEKRDKCVLKAETAGKVTALKATVGSVPDKDVVATIQNTEKLLISTVIPDYDVQKVKAGMKVILTTDASPEKIEGVVSRLSPTATKIEDGTGNGFAADITVTGKTDSIYIGTKAKAEIVTAATENAVTAPLDALGTDTEGRSVLYVKQSDGSFQPVTVTVGDKNEFYAVVSGEGVQAGTEVRAVADTEALNASADAMLPSENEGGGLL